MVAVTMCIGGIVLMAYAEGFNGPNAVGVTLSAGAAVGAALYKVKRKKHILKHYTHRDQIKQGELFKQGYR